MRLKKLLKRTAVGLGVVLGLLVLTAGVLSYRGGARLNRSFDVEVAAITASADDSTIARGRHLAEAITLCQGCHGGQMEGKMLFDDPKIATIYAPNLTPGRGGVGAIYTDADFVRAIRHGVNNAGRGMMIMHSDAFQNLSEADTRALISYLRSLPPVDNEVPTRRTTVLGRILVAVGAFDSDSMPLIPAEIIDHQTGYREPPTIGVTPEYGEYLVSVAVCKMCHGTNLTGGIPVAPGAPAGPNLVIYGDSNLWTDEQFITTLRTGVTPYGRTLDQEYMPWDDFAKMTDDELKAIRRYLTSLRGA